MSEKTITIAYPPIASREEWLTHRLQLLAEEKALTKEYDRLNAKRRRLPMVKVEKSYTFSGADGKKSLLDLFGDKVQLILYHFMFAPDWEKGCDGCTGLINAMGDMSTLAKRNTSMVMVSKAPFAKLAAYQEEQGWTIPWYSSESCDFNDDFGVTLDPARGPVSYNYKVGDKAAEWIRKLDKPTEMPGTSVFFRVGDEVFHTYSTFARGGESLTDSYRLLDITPYGRQEDFEDSPTGWPQKPTYE